MKNNFRTDLSMILRGVRQIRTIAPGLLGTKILQMFFSAGLPFISLWLSALLLDEIATGRNVGRLALIAAAIVLSEFAVSFICNALAMVISRKEYAFSLKYEVSLSCRGLSLDYERIEDSATHLLLEKIYAGKSLHNYGLTKIAEVLPTLFYHAFQVCFAVFMTAGIFFTGDISFTNVKEFLASRPFGWLILAFTAVTVLVASHGTNALSLKIKEVMEPFTYLSRAFDFYLNRYMNGYHAGKDVRLYRQDGIIDRELESLGECACAATRLRTRISAHYANINAFFSGVLTALVNVFVCTKAIAGSVGVGSVLKNADAINRMIYAASEVVHVITILRANNSWLCYYFEYLDIPGQMYMGTLTVEKRDDSECDVEFRDVSFRYPGCDTYALRHVSLKFRIGEKLAVVGMNGSGKTTFIKLLCRLYDPTEGQILLNGVNIQKYDYDEYMSLFSPVFQDFRLFSYTLAQNVACSDDYDGHRVEECLKRAGLSARMAELKEGIETCIYRDYDEDGVEISGGEAQKVAIARALYKDSPFIILDEPTAALDPVAEYEVYSSFNELAGERTAIYISHRLASCRFCDTVAVFDKGSIVQFGTHDELLRDRGGKYSELWHAQAKYYTETV